MGYKETLLNPIKIGNRECKNRFFAQPMECVDSDEEGNPADLTYQRYEKLYQGGFGLVDLEAITVTNESRARKTQLEIMPRSQIIRPFNDRDWKYGGSWERRAQWAYDLQERIAKAVNDKNFLIGSKMSMWEGHPGGFGSAGPESPLMDMTEPLDLIKGLEERGASYFIESLGNVHSAMNYMEALSDAPELSYLHIYFSDMMKKVLKPETVVIGSHFSPFRGKKNKLLSVDPEKSSLFAMGAHCIEEGIMDMVGLGRQSFADPLTPLKLMEGREDEIKYCTQCMNCEELMIRQQPVGCVAFNKIYTEKFVETRKKFGKLSELHT